MRRLKFAGQLFCNLGLIPAGTPPSAQQEKIIHPDGGI